MPRKSVFAQFDLDKDGKLSKKEAAALQKWPRLCPPKKTGFQKRGSGALMGKKWKFQTPVAGGSLYEGNHQLRFATSHLGPHCSSAEDPVALKRSQHPSSAKRVFDSMIWRFPEMGGTPSHHPF